MAVAIRFNHHCTCSHEKMRSHTIFIRLSTKSTLDEVGSPSLPMAEVRTQHCARETTEPIIFSEAQNGIKLLFHMSHLFARGYCLFFPSPSLSLSLSESLLFLSDQDKYEQENIQNRLVKKSYKLREDSDQTVRMRMLI